MKYKNIVKGRFLSRPNRFIAYVDIAGKCEKVHVKNTGRCRELLTNHAEVFLEKSSDPKRSTGYDLVAVRKGQLLINMDSQAPNKAVEEWLWRKELFADLVSVRPETTYGNSRFDFYVETEHEKIFLEVKGVTLEEDGVALFPDAPSERALKHVQELGAAVGEGYRAVVLLVVQMKGIRYFTPNRRTQPEFADALWEAERRGVEVIAYDCRVTREGMEIDQPVPVKLSPLEVMAEPLLAWYDAGRRILPWREKPTPYHVWVSEIMLQQTRVEAVKPYYDRFMERLPDIPALAAADEETLLKLWEGLGYYNRVRNLKKAAVRIMEEYGGIMPGTRKELMELPGIGSYTAGAVASIAYGRREPAVDGNVLRVFARILCDGRDMTQPAVRRQMEERIGQQMPADRPGDFNQALMELGAMVCIPNGAPKCGECPWKSFCLAMQRGEWARFPAKPEKKPRVIEEKTVLILWDEGRAALQKRPSKGLLAGMYEFPSLEGRLSGQEVLVRLREMGLSAVRIEPLGDSRHIFTHREWHMTGYAVRVDELSPKVGGDDLIFVERQEARDRYPIPSAYKAYLRYFNENF